MEWKALGKTRSVAKELLLPRVGGCEGVLDREEKVTERMTRSAGEKESELGATKESSE